MNYFELFDIPISWKIDNSQLTRQYYQLSKALHPDNYSVEELSLQQDATERSSQLNEAYKILKETQLRTRYILGIYNKAPEEGKDKMSQEFLMEMMDLNEAIMNYRMDGGEELQEKILKEISAFEADINKRYNSEIDTFNYQSPHPDVLDKIKECYLQTKYLLRLKDNLNSKEVDI